MSNKIKIGIDTMGGENSPKKIIDGIEISLKDNINVGLVNLWNPAAPTEANGVPW